MRYFYSPSRNKSLSSHPKRSHFWKMPLQAVGSITCSGGFVFTLSIPWFVCFVVCPMPRLKRLNLTSLEETRKRGDLIEMYKLLMQKENVNYQQFFRKEENQYMLRGHSSKVFIPSIGTGYAAHSLQGHFPKVHNSLS